jgi:ABC-type nitrate/sulfonate/bicarbonate transport system substrate-binding protein
MRTREFPVLSEEDEPLVARLSLGLGDDAARVLAYLLRRDEDPSVADEPAVKLAIRVGTEANLTAVSNGLDRLESRGLVVRTTADADRGRPPNAWKPRTGADAAIRRADGAHAASLLRQAASVAAELGSSDLPAELPTAFDDPPSERPAGAPRRPSGERGPSDARASFRVGLNWFPNALHAPLFAALAAGHYDGRGLDAEVVTFPGSDRAVEALADGDADVVVSGAATIARGRAADGSLVPLAPLYQRAMTVLYATREAFGGPLDDVESLRGRRVGMPVDAETGVLGRLFLSQSGVVDDVTLVDLSGEEDDALRAGRADVVTGTIRDPRQLDAAGETVDVLPVADHFPIYGPTLATTERVVDERPDALAAFLAGTVAGWADAVSDPVAAVRSVEGRDGPPVERAADDFARAADRFGSSAAVTDRGWGWHDADGWRRLTTALAQGGLVEGASG